MAIRDRMARTGLVTLDDGLSLTADGRAVLGVPVPSGGRRPLLRDCLDWAERRDHFGGSLPAALLARPEEAGRLTGEPHRAVRVHVQVPFERLGVDLAKLAA